MSEEYMLPWEQILYLTNGTDVNGYPLSATAITLHQVIDANNIQVLKEYYLSKTPVSVSMSGGCAVAAFNFPQKEKANYDRIFDLCNNWLKQIEDTEDDNKLLSAIITPVLMEGTFSLLLNNLVFAEGYFNGKEYRLILCFDNNETQPYILEGVDIGKMIYDADAEITRELNSLRQSIEEAEEITRNAKADNPYEKAILDKISRVNFNDSEEEDIDIHSGIRIAKEEEDKA